MTHTELMNTVEPGREDLVLAALGKGEFSSPSIESFSIDGLTAASAEPANFANMPADVEGE
jgi:hypothetical protein